MQDIILGGYHHSGFLRGLLEAFEQSHEVRPKKPPELFGFLSVTLIFYKQVLQHDFYLQVHKHVSTLEYFIYKLAKGIL